MSLISREEQERKYVELASKAHYPLVMANTMARGTGGVYYHAHDHDARESSCSALCGAKPRKRGYWSSYFGQEVDCPRCLAIIAKKEFAQGVKE